MVPLMSPTPPCPPPAPLTLSVALSLTCLCLPLGRFASYSPILVLSGVLLLSPLPPPAVSCCFLLIFPLYRVI
ncbi:hypothetical protein E2C01_028299 [Portunus trituberculatus]|uniref:Uncharacterized protein n=1 Tax=Portunus trituberculatus TaxID=210409 RepID=A0A5B7ENS9_PORTR|nr:hypothetical protein [Portunus trituberculatus]